MLIDFQMLFVRQFQESAMFAIGASERMGRIIRTVHLRVRQFLIQITLGQFHRIHRTKFYIEHFFTNRAGHQVYDQLGYVDGTIMVLSDFSYYISTLHCSIKIKRDVTE